MYARGGSTPPTRTYGESPENVGTPTLRGFLIYAGYRVLGTRLWFLVGLVPFDVGVGFVPVGPGAVSGSSVVAVVVARNQLIARSIGSRDNRPLLQRAPPLAPVNYGLKSPFWAIPRAKMPLSGPKTAISHGESRISAISTRKLHHMSALISQPWRPSS